MRSVVIEVALLHGPGKRLPTSIEELRKVSPNPSLMSIAEGKEWCNHSNQQSFLMMMSSSESAVDWGAFDGGPTNPSGTVCYLPMVKTPTRPWYLPPVATTAILPVVLAALPRP